MSRKTNNTKKKLGELVITNKKRTVNIRIPLWGFIQEETGSEFLAGIYLDLKDSYLSTHLGFIKHLLKDNNCIMKMSSKFWGCYYQIGYLANIHGVNSVQSLAPYFNKRIKLFELRCNNYYDSKFQYLAIFPESFEKVIDAHLLKHI